MDKQKNLPSYGIYENFVFLFYTVDFNNRAAIRLNFIIVIIRN